MKEKINNKKNQKKWDKMKSRSSELPMNEEGRYYHINCGQGDLARYILTCGDPERAEKIAALFDEVNIERRHREFITFTGKYRNIPLSVMATGIGTDNAAIAVIESAQCVNNATYIRLGSCGAIQDNIKLGDLVITERALRYEDTTLNYASSDIEAISSPEVLEVLKKAVKELGYKYHTGITCTTSDFYAGQGRKIPGFPVQNPNLVRDLRQKGVKNFEMEMAAYFILAKISNYPLRAGGVCAVYADRGGGKTVSVKDLIRAEMRCIKTGLRAVEILYQIDLQKSTPS